MTEVHEPAVEQQFDVVWPLSPRRVDRIAAVEAVGGLDGKRVAFIWNFLLLLFATFLPAAVLIMGSFMTRVGFFDAIPVWTTVHWHTVFTSLDFWSAVKTTLIISCAAGVLGPIIFSLIAYVLVRTRW